MTPAGGRLVNIPERVHQVVENELQRDSGSVRSEDRLADDLHADSMDVIEIVMNLETEFELEIPDEHAEQFGRYTVGDVVRYIEGRVR